MAIISDMGTQKAIELANEANLNARIALTKIAAHEAECGRRWGMAIRLFYIAIVTLLAILGTLLTDRFLQ